MEKPEPVSLQLDRTAAASEVNQCILYSSQRLNCLVNLYSVIQTAARERIACPVRHPVPLQEPFFLL